MQLFSFLLCSHTLTAPHQPGMCVCLLGGFWFPTHQPKQSVLEWTPTRCPLIQFNSDSLYRGVVSDPTDWGLSPTTLPSPQMPVSNLSILIAELLATN